MEKIKCPYCNRLTAPLKLCEVCSAELPTTDFKQEDNDGNRTEHSRNTRKVRR